MLILESRTARVAGTVIEAASRIQGIAEADTLVISSSTYRLIQGYFDCQVLGEQMLRGVAEPMTVYRVLSESGVQSRLDVAATRGLTPLVGREQEVGLLIERWEQAKDGQGQIILLSGEAGIGKSRLVQVLKDHVAEEPPTRWECRSSPYYQNTALYPIINLIQRTLRWQQDDTLEEKLSKLEQELGTFHETAKVVNSLFGETLRIAELRPTNCQLAFERSQELRQYCLPLTETIPLFAPLLSLSVPEDRYPQLALSPQRLRQQTLESIVAILLELAEREPVLFILEDLH